MFGQGYENNPDFSIERSYDYERFFYERFSLTLHFPTKEEAELLAVGRFYYNSNLGDYYAYDVEKFSQDPRFADFIKKETREVKFKIKSRGLYLAKEKEETVERLRMSNKLIRFFLCSHFKRIQEFKIRSDC